MATTVTATAPGRLDALGGVADYSGSLVLEVATEVATTCTASLSDAPPGHAVIASAGYGEPVTIPLTPLRAAVDAGTHSSLNLRDVAAFLTSQGAPKWAFYPYGSLAAFVKATGWLPSPAQGLALDITTTVPASQGVSSSASVEVATLKALVALSGVAVPPIALAHLGQDAENLVVGAPCGLMDQLSSMCGAKGKVLPIVCRPDQAAAPVSLPPGVTLVGWPSGVKHSVAGSPYGVARTATFMAKKIAEWELAAIFADAEAAARCSLPSSTPLPLTYLTQLPPSVVRGTLLPRFPATMTGQVFIDTYGATDDPLSPVDPAVVYPVAAALAFPVEENGRAGLALSLLRALGEEDKTSSAKGEEESDDSSAGGNNTFLREAMLCQLGELMLQSHEGYTSIGLGCDATDTIVRTLMRELGPAGGVYGARVSGGGSGGTVVVLCRTEALPAVTALAQTLRFTADPFPGLIQ